MSLAVQELRKHFPGPRSFLRREPRAWVKAVDGVSFDIQAGECFALVGESGCGKTTTSRLILLLEQPDAGDIRFEGQSILKAAREVVSHFRHAVQAVFQDPFSSLDPRMAVRAIVGEPLRASRDVSGAEIKRRVDEALEQVGLTSGAGSRYPHEFSGGQRQRIALARAISIRPRFIVLDEPVSALDVSIRSQIINLLQDIQQESGVGYLLISHDLAIVRHLSQRVAVMYLGRIVEQGPADELFQRPLHPYTQALLAAAMPFDPGAEERPDELPNALDMPPGCRFHPRCPFAMPICAEVDPATTLAGAEHSVACHLYPAAGPN